MNLKYENVARIGERIINLQENLMYVPSYLEYLDRSDTRDGWPPFVTDEGKAYATARVQEALQKYGQIDLYQAQEYIFERTASRPPCFERICLWDAIYAVAYRALLAVEARKVWIPK